MKRRPWVVQILTRHYGWQTRGTYATQARAIERANDLVSRPIATPLQVRILNRKHLPKDIDGQRNDEIVWRIQN